MQRFTSSPFFILVVQQEHPIWLTAKANSNNDFINLVLASHEQDILSALSNTTFNLILIDEAVHAAEIIPIIRMPGSINQHTPAIVLIGHDEAEHKKNLVAIGFDDCLIKPLTINNLEEATQFWQGFDETAIYLKAVQNLLDNCRNNRQLVLTLYEKLFMSLPQQVEVIETSLNNGDYQAALNTTHSLVGSVKTCYLQPIEEASVCLEKSFMQGTPELIDHHFSALKQRMQLFLSKREIILWYLEN